MNKTLFLALTLIVAISLGLLWQFYPLTDAKSRLQALPLEGASFVGYDVPLNDFEDKNFHNVNLIKRVYRINHENYMVTVLDGTHNRHAVHDPYYCFTGSGWGIVSKNGYDFGKGVGEELQLSRGSKSRAALFWFSDGKKIFNSPLEYWWKATLRRITLGKSGEEPVLIMIQPLDSVPKVDWSKVVPLISPLTKL